MNLVAGQRLGPYEIVAPLGAGGMGEVYRARDTKLNRDVAIKVLLPAVANDPDRLARFSREAQVLASLNHPNIAHIHGLEDSDGVRALVMELVEGPTLAERIEPSALSPQPSGGLPLDESLHIARQIADALEAAHEQGIIHRDLKPANIKVRPDGTVKVLDFGLAKALEPSDASRLSGGAAGLTQSPTITTPAMMTGVGMILGTAAYMSPEQARGEPVDRRADIWAFGCVLYEMLTGQRAFEGDTITDVIAAVVTRDATWTALPADTPVAIRTLLRRCLMKAPEKRLPHIGIARLEIDEALTASPVDANPASLPIPASRTPAVNRWIQLLPWSLTALAILAAVVVSFAYLRQSRLAAAIVRFTVAPPFGATRRAWQAFAMSPDGQTIAFRAIGAGGVGRIFTRRLDQADARPVAGTDNATVPFWSPDSRSLGFIKEGGLYRTDLDGSAPRRLCDVPGGASSGTWGTRGVIVFASIGAGLLRVPDTGGTPTPVTSLDAANKEVSHASPWFLPDGRRVLFLALAGQARGVIWAVSIDDPARTRVVESSGGATSSTGGC